MSTKPLNPDLPRFLISTPFLPTPNISVFNLCSAWFRIPLRKEFQYLFAFTREITTNYLDCCAPRLYWGAYYFSHTLHASVRELKFPEVSTLVQYVDDFLRHSDSYDNSRTRYLLQASARKGRKVVRDRRLSARLISGSWYFSCREKLPSQTKAPLFDIFLSLKQDDNE